MAVLAAELAIVGMLVPSAPNRVGVSSLLLATCLAWLVLQVQNSRLVACGSQAIRYEAAPRLVNRPEFGIRLAFHLLINWSAIVTTLVVAWRLDGPIARYLTLFAITAAVAVWIGFNVLHRRMNRLRNLALSTAIALSSIAGGLYLYLTADL